MISVFKFSTNFSSPQVNMNVAPNDINFLNQLPHTLSKNQGKMSGFASSDNS